MSAPGAEQRATWLLPGQVWVRADPISARIEVLQFLVVAAYTTVVGGLAGVIWGHVGNTATLTKKNGEVYLPTDFKFLLDNDLRFALVALVAGLGCAVVLVAAGRDRWAGPGAVLGIAAGGVLAALVAAHIGHQIGQHDLFARIHKGVPTAPTARIRSAVAAAGIDFKVNWWLGLVVWPFASVAVLGGITALRGPAPLVGNG